MTSKDWRPTAFVETAPGGVTEREAGASHAERRRALYALLRHLTALSSAALVLTATLVVKAFAQPVLRFGVGLAVVAFLLSLIGGAITHLKLLADPAPAEAPQMPGSDLRHYIVSAMATAFGFIVGMALLAAFFWANWFR